MAPMVTLFYSRTDDLDGLMIKTIVGLALF